MSEAAIGLDCLTHDDTVIATIDTGSLETPYIC